MRAARSEHRRRASSDAPLRRSEEFAMPVAPGYACVARTRVHRPSLSLSRGSHQQAVWRLRRRLLGKAVRRSSQPPSPELSRQT
eukprot:4709563-Prymnesium_polylepis.3